MRTGMLAGALWLMGAAGLADAEPQSAAPEACASFDTPAAAEACDRAIASVMDPRAKVRLLWRRAYYYNEHERYEEALDDLNAAIALAPGDASSLHERAYTLNALGRYREGEIDLDMLARAEPDNPTVYQERAFARFHQGNLQGAYEDRRRQIELRPDDIQAVLARVDDALWAGQFDAARQDAETVASAAARAGDQQLARDAEAARARVALWSETSPGGAPGDACAMQRLSGAAAVPAHFIGDCTALFMAAGAGNAKADALTVRSVALQLSDDEDSAVVDLQIAAALDPDNQARHVNLGMAFIRARHSWAARNEFRRAIELQPSWLAYAGLGAAEANLGERDEAERHARQSVQMQPNELAFTVLGDIAFDRGDVDGAKR
ncbi:MAG TPA: hypothetical protein VG841_04720, partial [Caulobacterales bacterium]|nr:hypothetical protein [Caulobacterales bacterium]